MCVIREVSLLYSNTIPALLFQLTNGLLDAKYVKSCRVRTARNLSGVALPPCVCRAERRLVEQVFTSALNNLGGDLKGQYYPLTKLTKEQEESLRNVRNKFNYKFVLQFCWLGNLYAIYTGQKLKQRGALGNCKPPPIHTIISK